MALTLYPRRAAVDEALRAVDGLRQDLITYIDLFHWSLPIDNPDMLALRDYTFGVVNAVGGDLEQAWISQVLYGRAVTSQSTRYAENARATGNPSTRGEVRDRIDELTIEVRIFRLSTIVSLAAALDCLAGSACSILGITTDVIKADLGVLFTRPDFAINKDLKRRLSPDETWRHVQLKTLEDIAVQIAKAGPAGWADWLLSERNTLVHRELPTDVGLFTGSKGRPVWHPVFPQSPHYSNVQALQVAPDTINELVLTEDSAVTLEGLVSSTSRLVADAARSLKSAWEVRRKTRPEIAWATQWKPASEQSEFAGYAPGTVDFGDAAALVVAPEQAKRLREAGVVK